MEDGSWKMENEKRRRHAELVSVSPKTTNAMLKQVQHDEAFYSQKLTAKH